MRIEFGANLLQGIERRAERLVEFVASGALIVGRQELEQVRVGIEGLLQWLVKEVVLVDPAVPAHELTRRAMRRSGTIHMTAMSA